MTKFKYIMFGTSEEFEKFQEENDVNIHNVMPYTSELIAADRNQVISIKVFVLYSEK